MQKHSFLSVFLIVLLANSFTVSLFTVSALPTDEVYVSVDRDFYFPSQIAYINVSSGSSAGVLLTVKNESNYVFMEQTVYPNITIPFTVPFEYGTFTVSAGAVTTWFWVQDETNLTPLTLPYNWTWKNVDYTLHENYTVTASTGDGDISVDWVSEILSLLSHPSLVVTVSYNTNAIRVNVVRVQYNIDFWFYSQWKGLKFRANGTMPSDINTRWNLNSKKGKWIHNGLQSGSLVYSWDELNEQGIMVSLDKVGKFLTVNIPANFDLHDSIFASGFETGDFSEWTAQSGGNIDSVTFYNGSYSAYLNSGGDYIRKDVSAVTSVYVRGYIMFYSSQPQENVRFFGLQGGGGQYLNSAIYNGTHLLIRDTSSNLVGTPYATTLTLGTWYCIEIYYQKGATGTGIGQLFLDGSLIVDGIHSINTDFDSLRCQCDRSVGTHTQYYDDIVISVTYVGPELVGEEYDYVDSTSNVDSSADIGTHGNFTAQKYTPDSINDTLTEEAIYTYSNATFIEQGFESDTTNFTLSVCQRFTGAYTDSGGSYSPHSGSWDVLFPESSGAMSLTSDAMDMSGASGIYVSFWALDDDLDSGGDFYLDYWNGSAWNLIYDITDISDDTWTEYSSQITDSQYFVSDFAIRITSTGTQNNEAGLIDDITIKKETIASTNYRLDIEEQFTSVNYTRTNEELCIFMGPYNTSETIYVQWYNASESTWSNVTGMESLTANSWNNVSVTSILDNETFTIRFLDGTQTGDTVCSEWQKDSCLLHTWETAEAQYLTFVLQETVAPSGALDLLKAMHYILTGETTAVTETTKITKAMLKGSSETVASTSGFVSTKTLTRITGESTSVTTTTDTDLGITEVLSELFETSTVDSFLKIVKAMFITPQENVVVESLLATVKSIFVTTQETVTATADYVFQKALTLITGTTTVIESILEGSKEMLEMFVEPSEVSTLDSALVIVKSLTRTMSESFSVESIADFLKTLTRTFTETSNVEALFTSVKAIFITPIETVSATADYVIQKSLMLVTEATTVFESILEGSKEMLQMFVEPAEIANIDSSLLLVKALTRTLSENLTVEALADFLKALSTTISETVNVNSASVVLKALTRPFSETIVVSSATGFMKTLTMLFDTSTSITTINESTKSLTEVLSELLETASVDTSLLITKTINIIKTGTIDITTVLEITKHLGATLFEFTETVNISTLMDEVLPTIVYVLTTEEVLAVAIALMIVFMCIPLGLIFTVKRKKRKNEW